MTTVIHINRNVIQHNSKYNVNLPVCRVQIGSKSRYCREVDIQGPSRMVYQPDKPLKCGAKLWIETDSPVDLIDEVPWENICTKMTEHKLV